MELVGYMIYLTTIGNSLLIIAHIHVEQCLTVKGREHTIRDGIALFAQEFTVTGNDSQGFVVMMAKLQVVVDIHIVDGIAATGFLPGSIGFVGLSHITGMGIHAGTEGIYLSQTALSGFLHDGRRRIEGLCFLMMRHVDGFLKKSIARVHL